MANLPIFAEQVPGAAIHARRTVGDAQAFAANGGRGSLRRAFGRAALRLGKQRGGAKQQAGTGEKSFHGDKPPWLGWFLIELDGLGPVS
jgi:hypothetical protein